MRIDRSYCSNQNTWPENHPQCIVVHNTDNFAAGADARALGGDVYHQRKQQHGGNGEGRGDGRGAAPERAALALVGGVADARWRYGRAGGGHLLDGGAAGEGARAIDVRLVRRGLGVDRCYRGLLGRRIGRCVRRQVAEPLRAGLEQALVYLRGGRGGDAADGHADDRARQSDLGRQGKRRRRGKAARYDRGYREVPKEALLVRAVLILPACQARSPLVVMHVAETLGPTLVPKDRITLSM